MMSSTVRSPPSTGSSVTSAMTRRAPSLANMIAIARPIPELAPVTTAILPASKLDIGSVPDLLFRFKVRKTGVHRPHEDMPMAGAIQPDLDLAASLFEGLSRATRRGRGIVRESYGDGEQAAHDLLRSAAEAAGLEVTIDAIGNLSMTLPGRDREAPSVIMGSHLDSVPQGGNFDGAAGVVAGLCVLTALRRARYVPGFDLTVMGIRAEESAWFDIAYLGSGGAFGL